MESSGVAIERRARVKVKEIKNNSHYIKFFNLKVGF